MELAASQAQKSFVFDRGDYRTLRNSISFWRAIIMPLESTQAKPFDEPEASRQQQSCDRNSWSVSIERLYLTYASELWAMFYSKCKDGELASDALHESFIRLLKQQPDSVRHPVSWLKHVGTNWLYDRFRRSKRENAGQTDPNKVISDQPGPADLSIRRDLQVKVRKALARISDADRYVLVLRYALNWPSKRIGVALNLAPEAIDMRMTRARRALTIQLRTLGRLPPMQS